MAELIDITIKCSPNYGGTPHLDSKGASCALRYAKGIPLMVPEMGDDILFGVHLDPQDARWVVTHIASGLRMCWILPSEMVDANGRAIRLTTAALVAIERRRREVGNTWAKMRNATLAAPLISMKE